MENSNKSSADKDAAAAAKEAAEKQKSKPVDAVFTAHPQLDMYYKTTDGKPFFTRNAAELHASGLSDKTVNKVTR
jgi:hypothetical protein